MLNNLKTLKLDSSYRPIELISIYTAFNMIYTNRANLIETYDIIRLRSVSSEYLVPSVISLNRYVKQEKLSLKCNRENIFWRDRNICQYCGKEFNESQLTLDHVTPRSRGGPKIWQNIVSCCKKCNQKKGDKLPFEVNMQPLKNPKQPSQHLFKILNDTARLPNKWLPYLTGYIL